MANNKKKMMSAIQFGLWIEEQAGAKCRPNKSRMECILNIDHIEPGRFAALYAASSSTGLLVVELSETFASEAEAWRALEDHSSPTYGPKFFKEWMDEQYLTDKSARVEKLRI